MTLFVPLPLGSLSFLPENIHVVFVMAWLLTAGWLCAAYIDCTVWEEWLHVITGDLCSSQASECLQWLLSYSLGQDVASVWLRSCHGADQACNVVSGEVVSMW